MTLFQSTRFNAVNVQSAAPPAIIRGDDNRNELVTLDGYRGMRIAVFGTHGSAPEDKTLSIELWAVEHVGSIRRSWLYGTIDATLGSLAGADKADIDASQHWADTIAWTPSAKTADLLTYIGGVVTAHSPADNTIGELMTSDFGNIEEMYFRVTNVGGGGDEATGGGVYIKLDV